MPCVLPLDGLNQEIGLGIRSKYWRIALLPITATPTLEAVEVTGKKPPAPFTGPSQWRSLLASDFPSHVHEPACSAAADKLRGVVVRLSVLMLEGILHAFGLSPVSTKIGAPFVAAILRSFACQETPSVVVLQALNEELTQGLPSDPAAAAGPQLSEPRTFDAGATLTLIEPPALSPADSALPCISAQPATEPSPAGQVPSLPPTMKLRLTRKGKRTAPVTATSPPPPRRQRVVSISSPTRSSDTSSTQETSLAREKASDLEVADPPLDLTAPVPIQSVLAAPPSSSGDQPPDSLAPFASPLLVPMSSAMPTLNLPSTDLAFKASWRLPSETDRPTCPLPTYRLSLTCSASLSAVQRAAELQREKAALKARLQELEPPAASSTPPEPSLGSLDAYLRAAGESAASALAISHAAFDKLQQLEAALKISESSLASEADRHQATVSELKAKEAELLSRSADLSSPQQSQELLQTGLADAQALETFPSFEADDGLFLLEAPHHAADPAPGDISAQALPAAAPETSVDPASSAIVLADPGLLPLASSDPAPSSSDVV
ncbi:uncharacterized protein KIAA1522-like [Zingiber officinale]|uniref:uncharacterized protein KIAA1522-like n=1 Tax=Zingiber officinale TaxID=94328 RepID=UPI001C4B4551|nr:uncharacterized protein KIAA1522-like [Zingiber officinale]